MTGVSTPLDDFFQALLFSATGTAANGSHTYSSVGASGGWLSAAERSHHQLRQLHDVLSLPKARRLRGRAELLCPGQPVR